MKTLIPLDIMGRLDGFGRSFDLDKYYRNRRDGFRALIRFSRRPEASSARDSVRQFIDLAGKERSEAGTLFLEEYETLKDHTRTNE